MVNNIELQKLNEGFLRTIDKDADGTISLDELKEAIATHGIILPEHVVLSIFSQADKNLDGRIDSHEFVEMIKKPENDVAFGAMKRKYLRYMNFVLPPTQHRAIDTNTGYGTLSDEFSCCPPPIFILLLSIVQILLFCLDLHYGYDNTDSNGPIGEALIYEPHRRKECWRFVSYMFVHVGTAHLVTNMSIQIILGTLLESVHKGHRIFAVYVAGVFLGSLMTSVVDPGVKLAGASGGVYSLITAHIATIIINWSEMQYPFIQLTIFSIVTIYDLGSSIYERYVLKVEKQIGYAAHLFGAIAGVLVGIRVLRNLKVTNLEIIIRRITFSLYIALVCVGIIVNFAFPSHFLRQDL